jgi:uncharacterized protein with FMN-binding domain
MTDARVTTRDKATPQRHSRSVRGGDSGGAAQTPASKAARSRGSRGRLPNSLVALGSAAVLAVYTAGYLRTMAASERLEQAGMERRRRAPVGIEAPAAAIGLPPMAEVAPPAAPQAAGAVVRETPSSSVPAAPESAAPGGETTEIAPVSATMGASAEPRAGRFAAVSADSSSAAAPSAPVPSVSAAAQAPAATGIAAVSAPVTSGALAATSIVSGGGASNVSASSGDVAAQPPAPPAAAAPAALKYKDGTYTGWGTSRHGDIQATVVIAHGRITSAVISECWTRWPCSWVMALPPQVVERQSAEVDYVSGATQSTNAFYWAVVDALSKAK